GRRTDHGTGDEAAVSMPPEMAIVLIGGLRELIAVQVESGRPLADLTDAAVAITTALLTTTA
ncbi:TetR/AcrR family transcriptional regulator, partial [Nocardia blacklockiae]|nr:TetR/AcrR family transcriptional regulator [Nocardia blacklockiae]